MTIPMIVMVISAVVWCLAASPAEGGGWLRGWVIDICRILFAVSAFWVVAGTVNRSVF